MKRIERLFYLSLIIFCTTILIYSCATDDGPANFTAGLNITAISPDSGFVGDQVTIIANGLVPQLSDNIVRFDGIRAKVISLGPGQILAEVPEDATSGPVSLEVYGETTIGPYFTVLTGGPVIRSVTPSEGKPGTRLTITGDNFLPASAAKAAPDSMGTFHRKPKADAPAGSRRSITPPKKQPKKEAVPNLDLPIEPPEGARKNVTLHGVSVSVTIGGELAPILSLSNTELITEVPEDAGGSTIKITVGDKSATSTAFTVILPPEITSFSPKKGFPGTQVTISGAHFNPTADSNTVNFNGTPATIIGADPAELVVTVPPEATSGPIKVSVGGQADVTTQNFTVTEAPVAQVTITDISPKEGPVAAKVTITGQNFSATKAENTVTFNGTEATINSASETELVVTVPDNATDGPVQVSVGSQTATGPSFNVTADPSEQLKITDINPKEGPVGTSVTITGQNFSATKAENTVTFNGTKAAIQNASTTKLGVTVPQGATTGPVNVTVGNQTATGPTFTVTVNSAPTIVSDPSFTTKENTTAAGTIIATDPNGDVITYSISDGGDQGLFSIDPNSGALAFNTSPDFENPGDANGNNIYEVQVGASDGFETATQNVTITVTDVLLTLLSLAPDPYAPGFIGASTNFTAMFSGAASGANPTTFVVRGRQSGIRFIGESYIGNGTPSVTTPMADFFPGESVKISLTSTLDLNPGVVAHYRVETQQGTGNFIEVTASPYDIVGGANPQTVALGDVDADGDLDIVAGNTGSDNISVLLNNGAGGFAPAPRSPFRVSGRTPWDMALGDINADGDLDIVVINMNSDNVTLLQGNGSGRFSVAGEFGVGNSPEGLTLGDVNADGFLDIVTANFGSSDISVLLGGGRGRFQTPAKTFRFGVVGQPVSVALGDVDADGDLDIVDSAGNVLLGEGNGVYTPAPGSPFGVSGSSVALGDVNADGALDIVIANKFSDNISVLLGNNTGGFATAPESPFGVGNGPQNVELGDVNADGALDIVAANELSDSISVLLNNGTGDFATVPGSPFGVGQAPFKIALGDVNADGAIDIVVANSGSSDISVLLNQ